MSKDGADGGRPVALTGAESVEALIGQEVVAEPTAPAAWNRPTAVTAKQSRLILYLGAAPGVGKTFAMLSEGRRRSERGTDVVVGCVETYGRPRTIEMLARARARPAADDRVPRKRFEEMDADAAIRRGPEVMLVDELAHTNIPGSRTREALGGRDRPRSPKASSSSPPSTCSTSRA